MRRAHVLGHGSDSALALAQRTWFASRDCLANAAQYRAVVDVVMGKIGRRMHKYPVLLRRRAARSRNLRIVCAIALIYMSASLFLMLLGLLRSMF
jgi:hypothetical protein